GRPHHNRRRDDDHSGRGRQPAPAGARLLRLEPLHGAPAAHALLLRGAVAGPRLLDLQGRAPADRRPGARRRGRRDGADLPVPGRPRVRDPPAAGVPRRRARARAGDPRHGEAARRQHALSVLPPRRRAVVPVVPGLHHEAQAGLPTLQVAARPGVAALPLLRDRRAPGRARRRRHPRADPV
ncbi:MAG: hypothetical protein AVDCRST_MAG79-3051, partial [uncultured Thermoleophilia bacterium]